MSLTIPARNNFDENPLYVYEWKSWSGFLFPSLYHDAIKIEARIRESNAGILKKIPVNRGYFLFHINLTKTAFFFKNKEELLIQLKKRNIIPLNAAINDTSKKYLQSVCERIGINVTRAPVEGDPDESMIIKTNFNHGGRQEKKLLRSEFKRMSAGSNDYNSDIIYPVMERKKIGNEVWNNENLIIEKYITNEQNYFYRVYKLLNRIVISEVIDLNLIKKMPVGIDRTNYYFDLNNRDPLPDCDLKFKGLVADIRDLSNTLNLDFAAIDVVKSDHNNYYIIDVNATPNWQNTDQAEILNFLKVALHKKKTTDLVEEK